jgi:hypothetical protein
MPNSLTMAGHQVQTSVADLLGRQWRLNGWTTSWLMNCDVCPCDPCSVPLADQTIMLEYEPETGKITEKSIDLSCVVKTDCPECDRRITINNKVRDCELTGCDGVSVSERCKVYLTHCQDCLDPEEDGECTPVKIFLQNNGMPVTQDEFGNPVPPYYLLAQGQLKYLCVVDGRIRRIVN